VKVDICPEGAVAPKGRYQLSQVISELAENDISTVNSRWMLY